MVHQLFELRRQKVKLFFGGASQAPPDDSADLGQASAFEGLSTLCKFEPPSNFNGAHTACRGIVSRKTDKVHVWFSFHARSKIYVMKNKPEPTPILST